MMAYCDYISIADVSSFHYLKLLFKFGTHSHPFESEVSSLLFMFRVYPK